MTLKNIFTCKGFHEEEQSMSGILDLAKFNYRKLSTEEKIKLLNELRAKFKAVNDVSFAYVYGSFIERYFFRDLDVAVWLKNPSEAFQLTCRF